MGSPPEHVIARLGPEFTAMARAVHRQERMAQGSAARHREGQVSLADVELGQTLAWGCAGGVRRRLGGGGSG